MKNEECILHICLEKVIFILHSSFFIYFFIYKTLGNSNNLVLFEPLMRMVMF